MDETQLKPAASPADFARGKLAELAERGILRHVATSRRGPHHSVLRGDQRLVSFCDNDYLGLSQHPEVTAGAAAASKRYGAGAGASRLVTGETPLYASLEARLAALKGHAAGVVFGSGYLANLGTIPVLAGRGDGIFVDRLAHACLFAGGQLAQASGAAMIAFDHNDMDHLETLLARHRDAYHHALILTDGVFSMDGDQAPLAALSALAERYAAWPFVDDAHGLGVLGDGRGTPAEQGVPLEMGMGTLSKALGAYGGYVTGPEPVIELIKTRARSLIYTTGLPPAALGAALAGLDVLDAEPERRARPCRLAARFCAALGLRAPQSPIVPILAGSPAAALDAQAALERAGFLVVAIRPPTVPKGTARLRVSFAADHREEDVDRLAAAVRATGLV